MGISNLCKLNLYNILILHNLSLRRAYPLLCYKNKECFGNFLKWFWQM